MTQTNQNSDNQSVLLSVSGLNLDTPAGRPLVRDLNLTMGYEQVAIVGRNGVGKSTLIELLVQHKSSSIKEVVCMTKPYLVPQNLAKDRHASNNIQSLQDIFNGLEFSVWQINQEFAALGLRPYAEIVKSNGFSCGELRKITLLAAKLKQPEFLLLDEPTEDLDEIGVRWLKKWLEQWTNGLIIISHERSVLQLFSHFFIMTETGCHYFNGSFDALEKNLEREDHDRQKKYVSKINSLIDQEQHNERVLQRRQQKKNQGRLRELGRMTPRVRLNTKRSNAQVSQGRVAKIRQDRIKSVRDFVKATRRHLNVTLPMELRLPALPEHDGADIVVLKNISAVTPERVLFKDVNLKLQRHRLGISGPNGAGKTTLLRIILRHQSPLSGSSLIQLHKVGAIAQGATDWMSEESLISVLLMNADEFSADSMAQLLVANKFPLALAQRPMKSLSPGERVRAALICLFARRPVVEFLILDEPAYSLDFVGLSALRAGLRAWQGGLIVVSHDREFLHEIGINCYLNLDGQGGQTLR